MGIRSILVLAVLFMVLAGPAFGEKVDQYIQDLKSDNSKVQTLAAGALVKIKGPAVEPLIEALKDKDIEVRARAAVVLGVIGD